MFAGDMADVIDNVLLSDGGGHSIILVCEQKTHLLLVVSDSPYCILFGYKGILQFLQAIQSRLEKGYFAVLIFFHNLNLKAEQTSSDNL